MVFGDLFIRHAMYRDQRILEDVHRNAGLGVVLHGLVVVTVTLTAGLGTRKGLPLGEQHVASTGIFGDFWDLIWEIWGVIRFY